MVRAVGKVDVFGREGEDVVVLVKGLCVVLVVLVVRGVVVVVVVVVVEVVDVVVLVELVVKGRGRLVGLVGGLGRGRVTKAGSVVLGCQALHVPLWSAVTLQLQHQACHEPNLGDSMQCNIIISIRS